MAYDSTLDTVVCAFDPLVVNKHEVLEMALIRYGDGPVKLGITRRSVRGGQEYRRAPGRYSHAEVEALVGRLTGILREAGWGVALQAKSFEREDPF